MKSIFNIIKAQKGVARLLKASTKASKNAETLEAMAKEAAFADMIKEGMPIYEMPNTIFNLPYHETMSQTSGIESIPYSEYIGYTTSGKMRPVQLAIGSESAFDRTASANRSLNNQITEVNNRIKRLHDQLNYAMEQYRYVQRLNSGKKPMLWIGPSFESPDYYRKWIAELKDQIKSAEKSIPSSLYRCGGTIKSIF